MQYQMSGAAAPSLVPAPQPVATPGKIDPSTKSPKHRPLWILLLLALAAGAAWYARQSSQAEQSGGKGGPAVVRTAAIATGILERHIRLTGTTGAENYVSLISPTLRGSRSFRSADASSRIPSGGSTNLTVTPNNTAKSSTPSSASANGNVASSMDSAGNGGAPTAMQSSTSRVSRGGGGGSKSGSTSIGGPGNPNASLGADGIGSTSAALAGGAGGGGGGGGGGGDFGLVLQELVKPGSLVKKGTVVAEFDRQNMLTRLDDYHASVMQTEAGVKKLKAELAVTRDAHEHTIASAVADLDKAKLDMKTTPVLGAIDGERIKLALEEAQARYNQLLAEVKFIEIGLQSQLKNAEIELEQAKIELKRVQVNADRMIVKAPIDGLTVMQNTFRGSEFAAIQQGDQLFPGQMFMQIVNPSSMVVNSSVNQVDVEHMRIGLKAKVRFDAYPGLELPAHIYSIAAITKPGGARASFVKEVPIRLKLDQMDPRVIPDLTVSAEVILESEAQATLAPAGAVFRDGPGKPSYVYVQTETGWDRREVQVGMANNISVSIRSGVKPGDVVAMEVPPVENKTGQNMQPERDVWLDSTPRKNRAA